MESYKILNNFRNATNYKNWTNANENWFYITPKYYAWLKQILNYLHQKTTQPYNYSVVSQKLTKKKDSRNW